METSEIVHSSTTRTDNRKHQAEIPRIIVQGDSHARRFAGELLHQVTQYLKVIGYVKPNAGITELLKKKQVN